MTAERQKADETCSIRLPKGTANKVRAATGQPLSRLCRVMILKYLENLDVQRGGSVLKKNFADAERVVQDVMGERG